MRKDKKKDKSSMTAGKRNQRTLSERITTDSESKAKKKKLKEDVGNASKPETKGSGQRDTINQVVIPKEKARSDKPKKLKKEEKKAKA